MSSEMATRPSWMDIVDAVLAGEDEVLSALFNSGAVFHSKAVEMICVREAIHMDSVPCLDILLAHGNKYDDYYKDSMLTYAAWHGDATFKWLLTRYTKSDIERLKKDADYVCEFMADHVMCLATSRWNYSRTIVSYLHLRDRADLLEYYQHHVGSIAEDYRILIYGWVYRCQVNETLPSRLIRNHVESLRDGKKKITNKSVEILVKNLQSSQSLMLYRLFIEVHKKVRQFFELKSWHQELRNYIVQSPYVLEEPVTRIAPSHNIVRQPSNGVEIHAPELPHDVLFEIAKHSPWMRMTCHGFYDIEHYRHLFAKEMLEDKEEERDYRRYCLVAAGDINFFDLSLRLYSTVPVITAEWMRLLVLSPVFMRRLTTTKLPLYIRDYHSSSFLLCKVPGKPVEFSVLNVGSSKTLDAIRKRKWWIDKINAEITARFLSTTTTTYNNPNAVTTLPRIDELELIDHDSELGKVFHRYKHPLFAVIYLLACHNDCSLVIPKTFHPEALHPYEIRWLEQFGKV